MLPLPARARWPICWLLTSPLQHREGMSTHHVIERTPRGEVRSLSAPYKSIGARWLGKSEAHPAQNLRWRVEKESSAQCPGCIPWLRHLHLRRSYTASEVRLGGPTGAQPVDSTTEQQEDQQEDGDRATHQPLDNPRRAAVGLLRSSCEGVETRRVESILLKEWC